VDATDALVEVLKAEGPRVLATLARTIGDLTVAEDALSEATITALDRWPATGIPDDPRAWLAVVARRKALDLLRRESARGAKETAAFRWGTGAAPDPIDQAIEAMEPETSLRDDMLRLIFTCCHPALSREAQVALSLRTLARLEVPAIARAFLVPEATMAKRLVRARAKIATARIPYAIPADAELPGRLAAVLAVVYLIATEAHAPTGGDTVARVDLEAEAIRLARLLVTLMPDEPEALSLLALLLLTSARTPARTDADGNPVTLADQDRARWNRAAIAEGSRWLSAAVTRSGGVAGVYQIQAHLAAAHSTAPSWQQTDWDRIVGLYDLLGSVTASPVVALNRAVAVTERDGPEAGLAALTSIAGLDHSHLWHAALADALARLGRIADAAAELGLAASLAPSEAERRLLEGRLRRLGNLSPETSSARAAVRPPRASDPRNYGGTIMTDETMSATTIINAPAEAIFAVLADPAEHAAIDGTGWVREPLDHQRLTAAGQVFRMAMYHENAPGQHYRMANRVQVFDAPRVISWEPGMEAGDGGPQIVGHVWRYDLAPAHPSGTEVTLSYDWSAVPGPLRERLPFQFPPFGPEHLSNSLAHLAELAAGPR